MHYLLPCMAMGQCGRRLPVSGCRRTDVWNGCSGISRSGGWDGVIRLWGKRERPLRLGDGERVSGLVSSFAG
jgi:hypothetical protein